MQILDKIMSDNKKNASWTMEEDEILIDFVKNQKSIYDVKCKDYRKTQMKLNLWKEIAVIIGNKTDIECSKRWAYVRDYYVRRKEKPGTGSVGEAARRRAEKLSFLDNCSSLKRSFSTFTNFEKAEGKYQYVDFRDEDEALEEKFDYQIQTQSKLNIVEDQKMSYEQPKRQNHSSNSEEYMKCSNEVEERGSKSEEQDETDLFFACMAKIVKKLPERERAYLRLQIGTIVGNAELRYLQQQNYNECSRPNSANSDGCSNFIDYDQKEISGTSTAQLHTESNHNTIAP